MVRQMRLAVLAAVDLVAVQIGVVREPHDCVSASGLILVPGEVWIGRGARAGSAVEDLGIATSQGSLVVRGQMMQSSRWRGRDGKEGIQDGSGDGDVSFAATIARAKGCESGSWVRREDGLELHAYEGDAPRDSDLEGRERGRSSAPRREVGLARWSSLSPSKRPERTNDLELR